MAEPVGTGIFSGETISILFDITQVQTIVSESTKNVGVIMMGALIAGFQEKLNFSQLYDRHVTPSLNQDLAALSEKTKMVYDKLFEASFEHIKVFSPAFLGVALVSIQKAKNDDADAPKQFLASFVLPEARNLEKKLKETVPETLECKEIWA